MNALRIRKRLESEMLHVPELRPMIGSEVEIIVLEEQPSPRPQDLSALEELAGKIDLDYVAIERLRELSKI